MVKNRFARIYLFFMAIMFFGLGVAIQWLTFHHVNAWNHIHVYLGAVAGFLHLIFFLLGFMALGAIFFAEKSEARALWHANMRLKQEIEDRKRAEAALTQSEARYRALSELSLDCIYWKGPKDELTYISPACLAITGYMPEEIKAVPVLLDTMVHPDDRKIWKVCIRDGDGAQSLDQTEFRILTKQGEIRWVRYAWRAVHSAQGKYLGERGSYTDITQHREMDLARLRQEKLRSVMEMAGAACHELNQPIQCVSGYVELLLLNIGADHRLYPKLQKIREQIVRMGNITGKLMGITRYETKGHGSDDRIIDLDRAAA